MSGRQGKNLAVLDALVRAMDRRDEVFQMIEDSEDGDEARRREELRSKLPDGR
jgi:hypothetical protein